jgi:hypothetical protein
MGFHLVRDCLVCTCYSAYNPLLYETFDHEQILLVKQRYLYILRLGSYALYGFLRPMPYKALDMSEKTDKIAAVCFNLVEFLMHYKH